MKKLFLTALIASASLCSFAQKGQQSVGLTFGYGTEISSPAIGVKYQYRLTKDIRLEGNSNYFFRHNGVSMWDANANVHYVLPVTRQFSFYPLAGVTITNWDFEWHGKDLDDFWYKADDTETRVGMNIGVGCQYDINSDWALNFDFKYQVISDFDQAVFGLGLNYKF